MTDKIWAKDPAAILDYQWDWAALTNGTGSSNWLAAGETIASATVTVPTGITKITTTTTTTTVTVWLSGGTDGSEYNITCQITTSAGRTDERTIMITCRNR